jgi:hypothetical protein
MFPKDATWIVICCNNNYFRLFIISENLEFLPKKKYGRPTMLDGQSRLIKSF